MPLLEIAAVVRVRSDQHEGNRGDMYTRDVGTASEAGRTSPISVLVVDDHAVFADALQARLSREPDLAPVEVGYSVRDGQQCVARGGPDVAVLDLGLGDGSGLELARHIAEAAPATQIIMLSAMQPLDSVTTALRTGARAWLPKTIDSSYLVRAIRGVHAGEAWISPELLGGLLSGLLAEPSDPLATLTVRERQILEQMVAGTRRPEIAAALGVSVNTIRTHMQNLMTKLDAHSVLEAVAVAMRHGVGV